jgi:O-antigen ligase
MKGNQTKITRHVAEPARVAAILLAATAMAQITVLGANTGLLAVGAAALNMACAIVILLLLAPPGALWARAAPCLVLLGAALLWAVLPDLAGGTGIAAIDATIAPRMVPDLIGIEVTRYLGAVAAVLAAAMVGYRRGLMRTAVNWLLILGGLNLLLGLVLRQIDPLHVWGFDRGILGDRFSGTLLNANASGCISGALALLAFGKWQEERATAAADPTVGRKGFHLPGLSLVLACAALGACVITGSRTAAVVTVIGLLLLAAFGLPDRLGRRWGSPLAIGAVVIAGAAGLLFVTGDVVFNRLPFLEADAMDRVTIWQHYYELAMRSPWFGFGLGSFPEINLHYLGNPEQARMFWYINAAHNSPIQLLLEGGWPYLLLIAGAILGMAGQIVLGRRHRRRDPGFRSMIGALLLIFACSLTDIALTVPAIITFAAVLLGLLWGRALRVMEDRKAADQEPGRAT